MTTRSRYLRSRRRATEGTIQNGQLRDFIPRAGDPVYPSTGNHQLGSRRQTWGWLQELRPISPATPAQNRATVIATGMLDAPAPIDVQLKFAAVNASGQPVLPWDSKYSDVSGNINVTVRRGVDPNAIVQVDTFNIDGTTGGNVLPFDIIVARELSIDLEMVNATSPVFVSAIAVAVEQQAQRDKIIGYPALFVNEFAASGVFQQFLFAHPDRASFIICNTSTNADLIISFGAPPVIGPPIQGTMVLPRNQFASYESPIGGFRGDVFGVWQGAGPTGNALVTEGLYY